METASAAAIVVTERKGHLSVSIEREMPGRTAVTIVAQAEGELPGVLAERVARKVAKQDLRQRPSTGVVCCGAQSDDAHWRARARIASSLLSAIAEGGDLIISARHEAGRHSLSRFLDLVDKLQLQGTPSAKCVRLRFGADSQPRHHEAGRPNDTSDTHSALRLTA
jgi:hypothetical protein